MRLFRRLPKRQSAEIAKNAAVATTLSLIVVAFVTALVIAFALPPLLSLFINDAPQAVEKVSDIVAAILVSAFFLWYSWDRVNATVGSAIEESAVEKFKIYQAENSSQELIKKQDREFIGMLTLMEGASTSTREHQEYRKDRQNAIARQTILKSFSGEDEFLEEIAFAACCKLFNKKDSTYDEIEADPQLTIFWQDLTFYLKAWLVLSIDNGRPMPVSYIKQRFPNQNSPDKWAYIHAIIFIKDKLIGHSEVRNKLGFQNQEIAIEMLKGYLNILVERLKYPLDEE